MTTTTKTRPSKQTYRQCVLTQESKEYVAWIPTQLVRINKHIRIDGLEGRWKVASAGDPKLEALVDWYAEHARKGLPDGSGPSTPMPERKPKEGR